MDELNRERSRIAERYSAEITAPRIKLPMIRPGADSSWHQYVIRCSERTELMEYLQKNGIGTIIHYPIPPYLSEAYAYLNIPRGSFPYTERAAQEVLSLPIYNGMTEEEQTYVIRILNQFSGEKS